MQTHHFGPITISYVARDEWDLIGRQNGYYIGPEPFKALVPHHTVTGFVRAYYELVIERMRYLQRLRPDLGTDIPYSWVVFAGATPYEAWVAEGRGLGWTGAHTHGYNSSVHAAAFWGNSISDPLDPAVLEAMRFCGRLMPYATLPTLDHGSYPNQGTSCAGTKLRQALPELQPPFYPANTPGNTGGNKEPFSVDLDLRVNEQGAVDVFSWPGYASAVSYDSGSLRNLDEITVELTGRDRRTRNVTFCHPNGAQELKAVYWGVPAKFVCNGSGWGALVAGSDAAPINGVPVLRVRARA